MAETYRETITTQIGQFQQLDGMLETKGSQRGLIDRITLKAPGAGCQIVNPSVRRIGEAVDDEHGDKTASGLKGKTQDTEYIGELVLFAGGRNSRNLPRLTCLA